MSATNVALSVLCAFLVLHAPELGVYGNSVHARPSRQWVVPGAWDNAYDGALDFRCDGLKAIAALSSQHDNYYEDRQFKFECRSLPSTTGTQANVYEAVDYHNDFDMNLDTGCPPNSVMVGMESYHSNHYEDRRWKFTCIEVEGLCTSDCEWTTQTNLEADINISVRSGYFFTAAKSWHYSTYEDRNWQFKRCKLVRGNCFSGKANN